MNSTRFRVLSEKIAQASIMGGVLACCLALASAMPPYLNQKMAQKQTMTQTQPAQQEMFNTPTAAVDALVRAAENDDVAALEKIFGAGGADIVSTGDPVADKNTREAFAKKARESKRIVPDRSRPNRDIVLIGADKWPLPIPLVKQGSKWRFDTKEGRDEILARRIGGNELNAINILQGYVEAQKEYASTIHDGEKPNQYAQRLISTPGKHDGLYWKNADGSSEGPMGEMVAKAIEQGYTTQGEPFHGYLFKILKGQGPVAPLGQRDYVVNGAMIGGFALVAVPARYRVTGVQTFIINQNGVVYQKDMGPDSLSMFKSMERYNPDKTWKETTLEYSKLDKTRH